MPDGVGKEKQKWISTGVKAEGNNKREANKRLREILVDMDRQKVVYSADVLFLDWIDKWMEQKKGDVRQVTYEGYESYLSSSIRPFYTPLKLKLSDITPQHIQDYYNTKKKAGLSANSIHKHSAIIHGALEDAAKKNVIPYNPADRATLPAIKKFISKAYSVGQANALLDVLDDEPAKPAIILGLYYGLRRSEACGLRWRDVDFDKGVIHIRNTVVKRKTLIEAEQTKSEASKRTLYIIPETREYLQNLKRKQIENRLLAGASYNVNDHVCVWADGKPLAPDYVSHAFRKILIKNNLPIIRFHELRHTAGSMLMDNGLSAKQIQEYLGHEKVSTTLDIYGHLSAEGKREAANVMGNTLAAHGLK